MWNSLKPFLLYVKFTNWTKKRQKIKNKKKVIIPILVLKQKTKHTHLKRCLYYNHLPQPLEICSPQKLLQKKKPSWSSDWVKKQSWNKIPMLMTMTSTPYPLAEKILMRRLLKKVLKILKVLKVPDWNTASIESTRLNDTGHAGS